MISITKTSKTKLKSTSKSNPLSIIETTKKTIEQSLSPIESALNNENSTTTEPSSSSKPTKTKKLTKLFTNRRSTLSQLQTSNDQSESITTDKSRTLSSTESASSWCSIDSDISTLPSPKQIPTPHPHRRSLTEIKPPTGSIVKNLLKKFSITDQTVSSSIKPFSRINSYDFDANGSTTRNNNFIKRQIASSENLATKPITATIRKTTQITKIIDDDDQIFNKVNIKQKIDIFTNNSNPNSVISSSNINKCLKEEEQEEEGKGEKDTNEDDKPLLKRNIVSINQRKYTYRNPFPSKQTIKKDVNNNNDTTNVNDDNDQTIQNLTMDEKIEKIKQGFVRKYSICFILLLLLLSNYIFRMI
jgi:hypothetical protein